MQAGKVGCLLPPQHSTRPAEWEKQGDWCDWGRKVEAVIKAALGCVTPTAGSGGLLPARHINLPRPRGAKIHCHLFYFYVLVPNENQIKNWARGLRVFFSFRLPSSSSPSSAVFSSPHRLLWCFEVQIRFRWCMKVKCRLYTRDHLTAREHVGCNCI